MAVYLIESKADQQKLIDHVGEDTAKLFFTLKSRLKSPENDIYYWLKKEPGELEDRLSELQSAKTRKEKDEESSKGAELVYNKDGWKVYHITTYPAAVKYGKGTQWCIAGSKRWANGEKGEEYFNDYTSKGVEFYFYIKNNDEKYALAIAPQDGSYKLFNAIDNDITGRDLSFLPNVEGLSIFNYDDLVSEDGTFYYEGGRVPRSRSLREKIKKVVIGPFVTSIDDLAFSGCSSLTSVTIPDSVTSIGDSAFWDCSSLTNLTIPDSVPNIRDATFLGCTSLTTVMIGDSVTSIGRSAFAWCESLTSVTIPDSVRVIGNDPFYQCNNLTVYTDNNYVIEYCEEYSIPCEPLSEFPR